MPSLFCVFIQNELEDVARADRVGLAISGVAIVNDLRGRLIGPGVEADGVRVRHQQHIGICRVYQLVVFVYIVAGNRLNQDTLWQAAVFGQEFVRGGKFSAGVSGHVRYQALDFGDGMFREPLGYLVHGAPCD